MDADEGLAGSSAADAETEAEPVETSEAPKLSKEQSPRKTCENGDDSMLEDEVDEEEMTEDQRGDATSEHLDRPDSRNVEKSPPVLTKISEFSVVNSEMNGTCSKDRACESIKTDVGEEEEQDVEKELAPPIIDMANGTPKSGDSKDGSQDEDSVLAKSPGEKEGSDDDQGTGLTDVSDQEGVEKEQSGKSENETEKPDNGDDDDKTEKSERDTSEENESEKLEKDASIKSSVKQLDEKSGGIILPKSSEQEEENDTDVEAASKDSATEQVDTKEIEESASASKDKSVTAEIEDDEEEEGHISPRQTRSKSRDKREESRRESHDASVLMDTGSNEMTLQITSVSSGSSASEPRRRSSSSEVKVKREPEEMEEKRERRKSTAGEKKENSTGTSKSTLKETESPRSITTRSASMLAAAAVAEKEKTLSTSKTTVSAKSIQKCIVCNKIGKCKYNIVRNGDIKHLCDDECFRQFRLTPTTYLRTSSPQAPPLTMDTGGPRYKTCSVCQLMNINTSKHFLNWQGLDFCGEECLGKFQSSLGGSCAFCSMQVPQLSKAKYCLKVGTEIKQFCSTQCHSQFKKRLKVCSFCQQDLTNVSDSFMAPVGWEQGVFKDFCSQACMQKYEDKNNRDVEIIGVEQGKKSQPCAVCGKVALVKHEVKFEGKLHKMCSDPCFSAFQYANKLTMNTCDNCGVYCYNEGMQPQYIQFEGQQKRFCSYMCVNTFRALNKKVVSCAWCGAKKSNFDMIERVDANNKYQLFCSLNCLSLYRVNLQATSNQAVTCDQCHKFVPAQYHLTMSDASVRNFCSYNCVMAFQSQFTTTPSQSKQSTTPQPQQLQQITSSQPTSTKQTKPTTRTSSQQTQVVQSSQTTQHSSSGSTSIPIISSVVSLAPQGNQRQQTVNLKSTTQVPVIMTSQSQSVKSTVSSSNQTQQIIIQPPPPKQVKNKSLLCKPFVQTKATSCRPHTQSKAVQTESDAETKSILVPVPVPIYVPVPLAMYNTPTPFPFPVPLPIPVPCFIPTTKKSANSILKHIKEIQEKIPADPFEAELLMMAEAVANVEKSSDEDDSEKSAEDYAATPTTTVDEQKPPESPLAASLPEPVETPTANNDIGDEVLQMTLKIASEMTEPVLDLESLLEPTPINSESGRTHSASKDKDVYTPRETRSSKSRGSKRSSSSLSRGGRRSKRLRLQEESSPPTDADVSQDFSPLTGDAPPQPPDTNLHLKYTYGLNAWRHWVVHKNAQLEKVSKQGSGRLKLFKTDLLQCTPDELNYSLCLFVKEVRKPNKEEYAADSIYYLCLGIQQYLFENGRIDNIFTDMYYEKFTECLNEVLVRYEPRINTAGQLVCRIEEEHLWECKQLGAHSPHVLLNTLIYFNTKHFMLKQPEDHMKLSFTHVMKHWKKGIPGKSSSGRSVYLRYYCSNPTIKSSAESAGPKKRREELPVYEQCENLDNPLRCPVKLYEFYLSKCPESIKNRNDVFYLVPERSCVPDSPVWYSTQSQSYDVMTKFLNRIRLVREIQESHLHTQPIYV